MCWIQVADKPARPHWQYPGGGAPGPGPSVAPGTVNPVTGKRSPGRGYANSTARHCETVVRCFYEFCLEAGTGPMVSPFPLAGRRRAHAHHNPVQPFAAVQAGRYRPRAARRVARQIPDPKFGELFASLGCHRDRALLAFWVSTGARAGELLGALAGDADPGSQLITVVRKGTRALQQLPALFGGIRAPSTLGSFLRWFTWGNVLQLGKVHRQVLAELAVRSPLLPGADVLAFLDVDSQQKRVYGHAKQGAASGPAKVQGKTLLLRGLKALAATVCTPLAAPVIAATRLRGGNAASARGAASLITEAVATAARRAAPA